MTSFDRRAPALALVLAGLLGAPSARAQATADEEAKSLFLRGRELATRGRCDEAVEKFRRAYELQPSGLGALRNLALCEETLGKLASARRHFFELKTRVLAANDPKYKGWDVEAETSFKKLEPLVPRLVIKLVGVEASDPRVTISVDRAAFDARLVGEELERDVGSYRIEARTTENGHAEEKIALTASAHRTVTLKLPALSQLPPPVDPAKPARAEGAAEAKPVAPRSHAPAAAAFAVGAVFAVGAAISFGLQASALGTIQSSCPTHTGCDPKLSGTRDRALITRAIGWASTGAAVVGVGVGVALWVSESRARPAQARLFLSPEGAKLEGSF